MAYVDVVYARINRTDRGGLCRRSRHDVSRRNSTLLSSNVHIDIQLIKPTFVNAQSLDSFLYARRSILGLNESSLAHQTPVRQTEGGGGGGGGVCFF